MFKKILSITFVFLLIQASFVPTVSAKNNEETTKKRAAKVRDSIRKLGVGTDARIDVKLKNKTNLVGYLSEASDDYFVIIERKSGESTKVDYLQVQTVKGKNLSTGAKVLIGLGIAAGVILVLHLLFGRD